jgi:hypothetical protein
MSTSTSRSKSKCDSMLILTLISSGARDTGLVVRTDFFMQKFFGGKIEWEVV